MPGKRRARASLREPARGQFLVWRSKLHKILWRDLAPAFEKKHSAMVKAHKQDSFDNVDATRKRIRQAVANGPKRAGAITLRTKEIRTITGTNDLSRVTLELPPELPDTLYALAAFKSSALVDLVDFQMNAVYPAPKTQGNEFAFAVAADFQWGTRKRVSASFLRFVQTMNELARKGDPVDPSRKPEFVVCAGDIVDCSYASAESDDDTILGADSGPFGYSHDYYQAWFALAALKLPAYVIPGNHDGYRFTLPFWKRLPIVRWVTSGYSGDGLLLFESTFGPTYFAFDRGDYRFLCLNSYDLPEDYRTLHDLAKLKIETLARKANKLNWGGCIRDDQHEWLRRELGLPSQDGHERSDHHKPLIFLHHDMRGAMPSLLPEKHAPGRAIWTVERHFPLTGTADARDAIVKKYHELSEARQGWAPRFTETTEMHEGFYTPFRHPDSDIGVQEWFEQWPRPPAGGGTRAGSAISRCGTRTSSTPATSRARRPSTRSTHRPGSPRPTPSSRPSSMARCARCSRGTTTSSARLLASGGRRYSRSIPTRTSSSGARSRPRGPTSLIRPGVSRRRSTSRSSTRPTSPTPSRTGTDTSGSKWDRTE